MGYQSRHTGAKVEDAAVRSLINLLISAEDLSHTKQVHYELPIDSVP